MFPFVDPIDSEPPVIAPGLLRPGRSIGRIEVDDLTVPWPEENIRTVLAADEHDPTDSDIYHHDVLPYGEAEDAYFMFPEVVPPALGRGRPPTCAAATSPPWGRREYVVLPEAKQSISAARITPVIVSGAFLTKG